MSNDFSSATDVCLRTFAKVILHGTIRNDDSERNNVALKVDAV